MTGRVMCGSCKTSGILCPQVPEQSPVGRSAAPVAPHSQTLDDAIRAHILNAPRATNGVRGGPHGAAARLGVKRTTLAARMEKLGIGRLRGTTAH